MDLEKELKRINDHFENLTIEEFENNLIKAGIEDYQNQKSFREITNIEQWYKNRLKELEEEKENVMKNECPCHYKRYGLKGYEDTEKCVDNNGDIESCVKCWNEVIK